LTESAFDEFVKTTVEQTFFKTLGADVWKAISFYFNVKTVATDPDAFAKVLEKLFGNASRVLKQVIGENLLTGTGGEVDRRRDHEFPEWIQMAKARFLNLSNLSSTGK
jgi:hypothetical protein